MPIVSIIEPVGEKLPSQPSVMAHQHHPPPSTQAAAEGSSALPLPEGAAGSSRGSSYSSSAATSRRRFPKHMMQLEAMLEERAARVIQTRKVGNGFYVGTTAAPLYNETYADICSGGVGGGEAGGKKRVLKAAPRAATKTPAARPAQRSTVAAAANPSSSSSLPSAELEDVKIAMLGGPAWAPPAPQLLGPITEEEEAQILYLAARSTRLREKPNYYHVLSILRQSPGAATARGGSTGSVPTARHPSGGGGDGGDLSLLQSSRGGSLGTVRQRRQLELQMVRDLYTLAPASSNAFTKRPSSSSTGPASIGLEGPTPIHAAAAQPASRASTSNTTTAATASSSASSVTLVFRLCFECVLLNSCDLFPGKVHAPAGTFTTNVSYRRPAPEDVASSASSASYADATVDWKPLPPLYHHVRARLPVRLVASHPHLQDFSFMAGHLPTQHQQPTGRAGASAAAVSSQDDLKPDRIANEVILAPSSVTSRLLPKLVSTCNVTSGSFVVASAEDDALVMDTILNPSQELIVVSASSHHHIRRRSLFSPSSPSSTIFLNITPEETQTPPAVPAAAAPIATVRAADKKLRK